MTQMKGVSKPSEPPLLSRRVELMELDTGLGGGELPAGLDLRLVPLRLPGGHFPLQLRQRPDAAAQALLAQGRQLDLRQVQPRAVRGRVVPLQPLRQPPRPRR